MPKKSREQKIKASQRLYEQLVQTPTPKEISHKEKVTTVQSSTLHTQAEPLSDKELVLTRYFQADFRKSMILISCVIALELIIYFASMSTNLAWLFKF